MRLSNRVEHKDKSVTLYWLCQGCLFVESTRMATALDLPHPLD